MKLAEALQERADLNRKIQQLRNRLSLNVLTQEGERPSEDPNELLKELDSSLKRLQHLISRINLTNCNTCIEGKSLTEIISQRDILIMQLDSYRNVADLASRTTDRARHSEIKIVSAIDVPSMQKKIDRMSKDLRKLENLLQETNWTVELNE